MKLKGIIGIAVGVAFGFAASLAVAEIENAPGYGDVENTVLVLQYGLTLPSSTVAALPTCNTALTGRVRLVSDATAPSYNGTLTGGGAVTALALCNGSTWISP